MPLYEYECQACKKVSEYLHKHSEKPPSSCSICKKGPLVKLVSRTHFKNKITPDAAPERDWIGEENAKEKPGNFVVDSSGHQVEVEPDDPILKKDKVS